jgi:imidazoleglycerol phosphate dehydratase HisB
MLETIAWRACMNIDASYANTQFRLTHVITEDVGIVLGKAFGKLLEQNMAQGVNGSGSSVGIIDEAMAVVAVSFEGRRNAFLELASAPGTQTERVEDMLSADLSEFFFGFAQGAGATVSIRALSGANPHHAWESIFRAFGEALKQCFAQNEWRKGTTAGVKGTLD